MFDHKFQHIFHDQPPGSNLCFSMPEETTKEVYICVRPTRGSGFSHYRLMVSYPGVFLLANTTLVISNEALNY